MKIFTNMTKTVGYQMIPGVLLMICLTFGFAFGAENIDPDADRILKSMSDYLGSTEAFSVAADTDFEIIAQTGQKLQLSSFVSVVIDRPSKFYITRKGMTSDVAVIYDGKLLTLHGKNIDAYAQTQISGTIYDGILAYELEIGLAAPGADFLFNAPYAVLSAGIEEEIYIGRAII